MSKESKYIHACVGDGRETLCGLSDWRFGQKVDSVADIDYILSQPNKCPMRRGHRLSVLEEKLKKITG